MAVLRRKDYEIPFVLISANSVEQGDDGKKGANVFIYRIHIDHELAAAVSSANVGQPYTSTSEKHEEFNFAAITDRRS
jgi:hypothetical protein